MRVLMHDLSDRGCRTDASSRRVVLLALAVLLAGRLGAQELTLELRSSAVLAAPIASAARQAAPIFVFGESLLGSPDRDLLVQGRAELRRGDMVIKADRMEYHWPTDQARASGQVRINRAGNVYEGPVLELKLDSLTGFFSEPRYQFLKNQAHGQADRVDFVDEQHTVIHNASLTTCPRLPGPDWVPDWILRATTISVDTQEDVGSAQGALLSFKGVPLLPIPYLSFPLGDGRKSGVLPPTLGLDTVNGAEVAIPYYWNIAPNRDATLTPTVMSKRGVNLASELRYLEPDAAGQLRFDWMPKDQLRDDRRWGLAFEHKAMLRGALVNALSDGAMALNLNLNRVSDNNYWRDFGHASASLTRRLLSNDLSLAWSSGNFSNTLRAIKWQTLQDTGSRITPPYDRFPQLATRYVRSDIDGFDYSVEADYTRFQALRSLTLQPNAERLFTAIQVSRPWLGAAGFITPKLQLHLSNYRFDEPLSSGANTFTRSVPSLSLDSGLVYEREVSYFGRSLRQTLEPRAFYVNTPYRDQSLLPNYDSGVNDFNFATIYTENAFVGNDRISDSNLLTFGVTTRLLNPDTGAEVARFGMAQRLRFKDQYVSLLPTDPVVSDRISDVLLGASINWDPKWAFDSTVQFNPTTRQSVRSTIGGRYNPGPYRTVSAAYRYQRDASEQIDLGWQWPVNDLWGERGQDLGAGQGQGPGRWYSVGRLNYSLMERKLVDAVIGFEYDAGCWLGRAVLEKLQTSESTATQRIMFQLEFVGLTRLGVSPLKTLKENVPSYQYLREPTGAPSRFSNYE